MRFKKPKGVTRRDRERYRMQSAEAWLRKLAEAIPDQAALDRVLKNTPEEMRGEMLDRLRPFLSFEVAAC